MRLSRHHLDLDGGAERQAGGLNRCPGWMILFDGAVAQILIHRDSSYALSAGHAASTLLKRTNKSKKRRSAQPSTAMAEGS